MFTLKIACFLFMWYTLLVILLIFRAKFGVTIDVGPLAEFLPVIHV